MTSTHDQSDLFDLLSFKPEVKAVVKAKTAAEKLLEAQYDETNDVHFFPDGHYWLHIPALPASAEDDDADDAALPDHCYKPPGRISFSREPILQGGNSIRLFWPQWHQYRPKN